MKKIELTQGKFALVDDEDFEYLNQWKWCVNHDYAVRNGIKNNARQSKIFMHRVLMNTPKGLFTDHVNHNKLDNRKFNLRIVTKQQNQWNMRKHKDSLSPFKGVSFIKKNNKWNASIRGKHIGEYDTAELAASAYNGRARKLFGKFALLNKI